MSYECLFHSVYKVWTFYSLPFVYFFFIQSHYNYKYDHPNSACLIKAYFAKYLTSVVWIQISDMVNYGCMCLGNLDILTKPAWMCLCFFKKSWRHQGKYTCMSAPAMSMSLYVRICVFLSLHGCAHAACVHVFLFYVFACGGFIQIKV